MKVISWNVRGLGLRLKRRAIRGVLRRNRADIIFIQESKREKLTEKGY